MSDKQLLRRMFRQRRDSLDSRATRSADICARVAALPRYQQSRVLHCYLPIGSEVDTSPLLAQAFAQHKRVVVPVVQRGSRDLAHSWLLSASPGDLETGVFQTLQPRVLRPALLGDWDMVIVPLLAFDRRGYRLGYGKGYYDRLLTAAPAATVGVAFAAQEAERLPNDAHDIPLNWIVTEHEVIAPDADAPPAVE
jgi:5-formyltetrahydrofolate cyclo-ligase